MVVTDVTDDSAIFFLFFEIDGIFYSQLENNQSAHICIAKRNGEDRTKIKAAPM